MMRLGLCICLGLCLSVWNAEAAVDNTAEAPVVNQGPSDSQYPIDSTSSTAINMDDKQLDPLQLLNSYPIKTIKLDDPMPSNEDNDSGSAATATDFCSRDTFTLDEAVAHAASIRKRGSKPLGFKGAPYASLAPWTCLGKITTSLKVPQRIPGPRERLLKAGRPHPNVTAAEFTNVNQLGIQYHGGFVTNPLRFYYIWYGDWPVGDRSPSDSSTVKILEDLANSLPNSCAWSSTASYQEGSGNQLVNDITFAGSIFLPQDSPCWQGSELSYGAIDQLTACLLESDIVSNTPSTLFLTMGSGDVSFTGFCTQWCGWHDYSKGNLVGFIGSNKHCRDGCTPQTNSPNNNNEADSMASIVFHELTETATDPQIDAWYRDDENQNENADLCAWNFKPTAFTPAPGGGKWNTFTHCPPDTPNCVSRYWLLQKNWANIAPNGVCQQGAYPAACPPGTTP
eukprot:jgi/Botrbrau1/14508/Bobra.0350s0013.1